MDRNNFDLVLAPTPSNSLNLPLLSLTTQFISLKRSSSSPLFDQKHYFPVIDYLDLE